MKFKCRKNGDESRIYNKFSERVRSALRFRILSSNLLYDMPPRGASVHDYYFKGRAAPSAGKTAIRPHHKQYIKRNAALPAQMTAGMPHVNANGGKYRNSRKLRRDAVRLCI